MSPRRKTRAKAGYMISSVAELYKLHPQTLRLYERVGLLKPSRSEGNTRLYTDDDLERVCPRLPAPGYPEEARSVGLCLGVVMKEECEHRRYAVRDLAALEADPGAGAAHRDAPA